MSVRLDQLIALSEFHESVRSIFPSAASLRWFVRVNRRELVDAGALVQLAGRHFIAPERFAAVAHEIGARAAANRRRG